MTDCSETNVQLALQRLVDPAIRVLRIREVGGGCISASMRVDLDPDSFSASTVFVKTNCPEFCDNFLCECDGLDSLSSAEAITVPRPLASGEAVGGSWLVTPWVETGSRPQSFYPEFGQQLARLHQTTAGDPIGWPRDNYLGAAKQKNGTAATTWPDFLSENRIGFQLRWAVDQRLADHRLKTDCQAIVDKMGDLLKGRREETSLLHGDLWSGNYLCDSAGQPVLIDPAVYRGCHEAEFGMIRLFGSCPESFYEAYQQTWPMRDGWQRRTSVYVLYHLLNHLNLFGSGYAGQCRSVAAEVLRAT
ncbi:fructosamine kinase family protein [Novipirellula artificiosorum]|uniref:Fructosamine kinase n=1 Tax=Novipirellula artificiosorum TaxID=2528016 RepID=A0A5C6DH40_9BACT|nr:fructosamine kinase family protein [Novipirellula artificiosorum]TWU34356.1 Fructosamine kinase [Novipirellula artificiosorum]